jgi:hypothetical protein
MPHLSEYAIKYHAVIRIILEPLTFWDYHDECDNTANLLYYNVRYPRRVGSRLPGGNEREGYLSPYLLY